MAFCTNCGASKGKAGGSFQLKCSGTIQQVADYYEQALKGAGLTAEKSALASGATSLTIVKGADKAGGRDLTATVTSGSEGTIAHVMYSVK